MQKILIVDDNKAATDIIQLMLESSGYPCAVANNGQECLSLLRKNKFDLVLLDVAMPDITGIDVLKRIRDDPALNHTGIVFLTALPFTDAKLEELKDQVLDCVGKPVSRTKLVEVVSKCLPRSER